MAGNSRLIDGILIARDLYKSVGTSGFPVPLNGADGLVDVVIKRMQLEYAGNYNISLIRGNYETSTIQARLNRYTDRAEIRYPKNLNVCESRFAISKELVHLQIDNDESKFTSDIISLIQALLIDLPYIEMDDETVSEKLAIIVAIEVLLPWKLRPVIYQWDQDGLSDRDIAEKTRVPEVVVNAVLRSPYRRKSHDWNSRLDASST